VLLDDGGRPQWLASCWRTAVLRDALDRYQGGSLHGLLRPLRPALLAYAPAPGEPPPWLDCDTPEDLALARRLAAGPPRAAAVSGSGQPPSRAAASRALDPGGRISSDRRPSWGGKPNGS
jgi:hypothetical protein